MMHMSLYSVFLRQLQGFMYHHAEGKLLSYECLELYAFYAGVLNVGPPSCFFQDSLAEPSCKVDDLVVSRLLGGQLGSKV